MRSFSKLFISTIFTLLLAAAGIYGQALPAMSYVLVPVPKPDRTELRVELTFKPADTGPVAVKMPVDCFGTPDLYKYVSSFSGMKGTVVKPGNTAAEKFVEPGRTGEVNLNYTLSYDPAAMQASPYAPSSGPDRLHLAGCQWLLPVGGANEKREYNIEIRNVPPGWKMYSSVSVDVDRFKLNTTHEELSSEAIGGGVNSHIFFTGKSRVAVYADGSLKTPVKRIYASVEQIVRLQRKWFGEDGQPNYTITIAPRSGFRAGFATGDMFVCFIDPATSPEALSLLVAHEFFHNWLPNRIKILQPKVYSGLRYEWFNEGFPEYFAYKILSDSKLISAEQFADSVNANILNIADNPNRSKTYDELTQMAKDGKFDGDAKKLAYFRGFLLAANWDARIKKKNPGKDLSNFIRELYSMAAANHGNVSEDSFFELAGRYGIDPAGEIERHIIRGENIVPEKDALGPEFRLQSVRHARFNAGFDVASAYRTHILTGVDEFGPAFKAGLRNGMTFVGGENLFRFSNAWERDKPIRVKVKIDGAEKTVEYFPHGEQVLVSLFARSARK